MPNCSTHPRRSLGRAEPPVVPKVEKGEIPFTVLEISHTWNRDVLEQRNYQASYQKFKPKEISRTDDVCSEIRNCIRSEDVELEELRELYNKVLADESNKYQVPTRLMRELMKKIEQKFSDTVQGAVDSSDIEGLEHVLNLVEEDRLLHMIMKKTMDLDAIKAMVPTVRAGHVAKVRDALDAGGSHRQSTYRRASNADLMRAMKREMVEGWEHITFNPETGRLQLVTEVLFEKRASVYMREAPTATFQDNVLAGEVMAEIAKVYQIFQVPFCVVQVHKSPYKAKAVDGGEHEGWLYDLARSRAEKMRQELVKLGVPPEVMTAKAEVSDRTTIMQFCEFTMSFNHVSFDSKRGYITLRTPISWEKRLFSRDQQDIPDAQFAESDIAQEVLLEVMKIAKFYGGDLDVVVHQSYTTTFDDEHKSWLDELLGNRSEKVKDELADLGLREDKISCRVEGTDSEGMGLHFETITNMGVARTITTGHKGPDHVLEVEGSGIFEFNGRYRPGGTHQGKPKYRHVKGGKETITHGSDGYWYMCYNHNTGKSVYKSRDLADGEIWQRAGLHSKDTGLLPIVKMIKNVDGMSSVRSGKSMSSTSTRSEKTVASARTEKSEVGWFDSSDDSSISPRNSELPGTSTLQNVASASSAAGSRSASRSGGASPASPGGASPGGVRGRRLSNSSGGGGASQRQGSSSRLSSGLSVSFAPDAR